MKIFQIRIQLIDMEKKRKLVISFTLLIILIGTSVGNYFIKNFVNRPDWEFELSINDYPNSPGENWNLVNPGIIPISNPLKGFMPYVGEYDSFPYSLEYTYFPVKDVVGSSSSSFDFTYIENNLTEIAARGNQAVFRLFFDYPGGINAIPQYLIDDGLLLREYTAFGGGFDPDYDDPRMIELMGNLIENLATNFDGDPRIGFIQIGLLGHWGEWHTYPDEDHFANETTQNYVLEKFDNNFNRTKILARYVDHVTTQYNVGFHDDSFAYSTLCPDSWCFHQPFIDNNILDRWENEPIGGEVRPELQVSVFKEFQLEGEDIIESIDTTHASWMLITSVFNIDDSEYSSMNENDIRRASIASAKLGYLFAVCYHKTSYNSGSDELTANVLVHNFGIAPFYYNWSLEFAILSSDNSTVHSDSIESTIDMIPSNHSFVLNYTWASYSSYQSNADKLGIRVINPLSGGKPVIFANEKVTEDGWTIFTDNLDY
jgi:hypothetical protein